MQRKMGGVLAETWARLTACVLRIMEKMEHYGIRSVAKLCFSAENDASDDTTETQEQRTSNPRNALTRFLCSPSIETWILCFLVVLVVDIVGYVACHNLALSMHDMLSFLPLVHSGWAFSMLLACFSAEQFSNS